MVQMKYFLYTQVREVKTNQRSKMRNGDASKLHRQPYRMTEASDKAVLPV